MSSPKLIQLPRGVFQSQLILQKLAERGKFETIKKIGEKCQSVLTDFTKIISTNAGSYLDIVNVQKVDLKAISPKFLEEKN
ncbi:unnamed protein product, partial [marine sediment metagenome]